MFLNLLMTFQVAWLAWFLLKSHISVNVLATGFFLVDEFYWKWYPHILFTHKRTSRGSSICCYNWLSPDTSWGNTLATLSWGQLKSKPLSLQMLWSDFDPDISLLCSSDKSWVLWPELCASKRPHLHHFHKGSPHESQPWLDGQWGWYLVEKGRDDNTVKDILALLNLMDDLTMRWDPSGEIPGACRLVEWFDERQDSTISSLCVYISNPLGSSSSAQWSGS